MAVLSIPVIAWFGLILTPVAIAIGQILFKLSSAKIEQFDLNNMLRLALDPVFILAVGIYAASTIVWVMVLRLVPLSMAYSFMSIAFIMVPLLSALFLGEALGWRSFAGAGLIIAGVIVVNG